MLFESTNLLLTPYMWKGLQALAILVGAQTLVWLTKSAIRPLCGTIRTRLALVAPTLIWLVAIGALFVVFGIDLNSITEILIAGGLVIGLIVSSAGNNIVCGMLSIYNDTYRMDEVLEINGIIGRVMGVTMLAIHLQTLDGSHYEIPHKLVWESIVHNFDRINFFRIKAIVHIDDENFSLLKTKEVLQSVVESAPQWNHFDSDKKEERLADVCYVEMASSSHVFEVIAWIKDPLYAGKKKAELLEQCQLALDAAGISTGQTSNLSGGLRLEGPNGYLPLQPQPSFLIAK